MGARFWRIAEEKDAKKYLFKKIKNTDLSRIKAQGKKISTGIGLVFYLKGEGPGYAVAAGRKVGRAVDRNRIKRKIREAIRQATAIKGKILIFASKFVLKMKQSEIIENIYGIERNLQ